MITRVPLLSPSRCVTRWSQCESGRRQKMFQNLTMLIILTLKKIMMERNINLHILMFKKIL